MLNLINLPFFFSFFQMMIFILFSILPVTRGIVGYDCGARSLNITTLSLLDVGPCNIPQNPLNITRQFVQLLQINEYRITRVISCKLEIHRTVYHCGMSSHLSLYSLGEAEYIFEISEQKCLEVYHTGILRLDTTVVSDR